MNKIAVITGGSSGIGFHLANMLANKGYLVFELSRNGADRERVVHIHTDVAVEASVKAAFAQIAADTDHIDLLINNAGMGISGAVEYARLEEVKNQFDVNFFGMVCTVQHAIPLLKSAKGRIVNISSAAAMLPVPFQTFYSASKAAINAYSLALANELKRFGITICAVMPGDVKTGFTAARRKSIEGDEAYAGAIERSVSLMEHDEQNGMDCAYVANRIYTTATGKRAKILTTIGTKYKLFVVLSKLLPATVVNRLIGSIYAK